MTAEEKPHFFNVGEMIHYLFLEKRLSALQVAQSLGVSVRYLASIERGDIDPTIEQVEQLRLLVDAKPSE